MQKMNSDGVTLTSAGVLTISPTKKAEVEPKQIKVKCRRFEAD
jgi:hypothetical protein